MKLRLCLSAALVLVFASAVFAENNEFRRFDIGWNVLSYSRQGSINAYGGDLSFAFHASKRIAVVADFAAHQASVSGIDLDTFTYRFGPRYSRTFGSRLTAFGEVLAGGTRLTGGTTTFSSGTTTTTSTSFNGFALAAGGGLDIGIRPWFAWRAAQLDYSLLRFGQLDATSNGIRVGSGIVFRFGS
jgi:hypothetical protein